MASSTSQLVLLAILLSVDAILLVDARPPENKIIGGSQIDIKDVPWQVALRIPKPDKTSLCGGSIINDRWVMTAAHCTFGALGVMIIAGTSRLDVGGTLYKVVDIKNHPRYNRYNLHNDIALIKTDRPIVFGEKVAKATLPKAGAPPPQVGTPLLASGWGRTSNDPNAKSSKILMAVEVEMDNFATCAEEFSPWKPDVSTQICAGLPARSVCKGDSGGPLMRGKVVIGISSYANTTVCGITSAGFTKVSAYMDWIQEHTRI